MEVSTTNTSTDTIIGFDELSADLSPIASKWEDFGGQLTGLGPTQMDEIAGRPGQVSVCFPRVIEAWIKGPPEKVNKEVLLRVLRTIEQGRLADELEKKDITLDFQTLERELKSCRHDYYSLGIQLGVSRDRIKEWEVYTTNCQRCLKEVLGKWLENCAPKLEDLVSALKYIGYIVLAEELQEKYRGTTQV